VSREINFLLKNCWLIQLRHLCERYCSYFNTGNHSNYFSFDKNFRSSVNTGVVMTVC